MKIVVLRRGSRNVCSLLILSECSGVIVVFMFLFEFGYLMVSVWVMFFRLCCVVVELIFGVR